MQYSSLNPRKLAVGTLVALGLGVAAHAQEPWPSRAVRLIVPYPAGGPVDIITRDLADALSQEFGQTFVVENKPGAGASIGAAYVARAKPDGYTFLAAHKASVSLTPQLRDVNYSPLKDFTPVAGTSSNFTLLVARKDFGPSNMAELKAFAQSAPNGLTCATAGIGSGSHLACEILRDSLDVPVLSVHYKGLGNAFGDMMTGRVDVMFDPSALQHVKNGTLKVLGVRGKDNGRFSELPDVPSFAEQGHPDITDGIWSGMVAPAGTDSHVIQRFAAALEKIINTPEMTEKLLARSSYPNYISPETLGRMIPQDYKYYTEIVKKYNLKLN